MQYYYWNFAVCVQLAGTVSFKQFAITKQMANPRERQQKDLNLATASDNNWQLATGKNKDTAKWQLPTGKNINQHLELLLGFILLLLFFLL